MIYELQSEISLMCLKSPDGPQSSAITFDRLENELQSLKGRKFYGLVKPRGDQNDYYACVATEEGDEPEKSGLERLVLSKGKYDREKITDWENKLDLIPKYFDKMVGRNIVDESRFSIEYYRSRKELFLMLPVK